MLKSTHHRFLLCHLCDLLDSALHALTTALQEVHRDLYDPPTLGRDHVPALASLLASQADNLRTLVEHYRVWALRSPTAVSLQASVPTSSDLDVPF